MPGFPPVQLFEAILALTISTKSFKSEIMIPAGKMRKARTMFSYEMAWNDVRSSHGRFTFELNYGKRKLILKVRGKINLIWIFKLNNYQPSPLG